MNTTVEQDLRFMKRRIRSGYGFTSLDSAKYTLIGIDTVRVIQKNQLDGKE